MSPEHITDTWLSERLNADVAIRHSQRIGDGLVGMNVRYELLSDAALAPSSLIAKLPSPDPTSRATGVALRNYEREVKFYQQLASTVDVRTAACYYADWCEADGDFVLLLEDLTPAAQGNQLSGCDETYARRAVLELAKLHGPRWGDPALDELEWLQRRTADDAAQLTMLWDMFVGPFLATYRRHLSTEAQELVQRFGERLADWIDGREPPFTVTHGDYRLDNMMFATEAGGAPIAVVDWQTPGHGQATLDLAYFLGAGPLPTDRRRIERGLVDEYGAALNAYGVDVGAEWLWHHYRRDAYGGVIMSVVASQIVGASERSEAMFAAMATRHCQHVLDLGSESLI